VPQSGATSEPAYSSAQVEANGRVLPITLMLALVTSFVAGSFSYAGLYADGANYLLNIISSRGLFNVAASRIGAELWTQSPVILAIHLGDRSIAQLAALYTASLMTTPIASLCATTWITRNNLLASAANIAVICCVYYPTIFEAIGEFQVLYSLFWLSAVLILAVERPGAITMIVIALAAVVMTASYELALLTGPILSAVCLFRALRLPGAVPRLLWVTLAVVFLAGAPTAAQAILVPRDSVNEGAFAGELKHFYNDWTLSCLAGIVVLCVSVAISRRPWSAIVAGFAAAVLATYFVWRSLTTGVAVDRLLLGFQDPQRAQVFPYLLAAFGALVLSRMRVSTKVTRPWALAFPVLIVFALHIGEVSGWRGYLRSFCAELSGPAGGSSHTAFLRRDDVRRFGWDWELPTLSLLLRPAASQAIVRNPAYRGWIPATGTADIRAFKRTKGICREPL
jgi:hypothetical protein